MMAAPALIPPPPSETEVEQLKARLVKAEQMASRISLTLLGLRADAEEALSPVRIPSTVASFRTGLDQISKEVDELKKGLRR